MMKTTLAALAALLLAGGTPLIAGAQTQDGPIRIDAAHVYPSYVSGPQQEQQQILPGFADVAFTNQGAQTATSVEFAVVSRGNVLDRATDVGSFASGVTIKHQFPANALYGHPSVLVAAVTFADGSTWRNPRLAPAPAADAGLN